MKISHRFRFRQRCHSLSSMLPIGHRRSHRREWDRVLAAITCPVSHKYGRSMCRHVCLTVYVTVAKQRTMLPFPT
eukprot:6476357-Amphidinium_carterae.1